MSFEPSFTVTHAITADLTRIERARGFLEAATLSEDWIRQMGARALVLEAHHTTHIEGTKLTLEESRLLFAGEAVPEADPDDVRELLNYRDAFEFVSTWLGSGGPITEGLVREIHKCLVEGVRGGSAAPGEYRRIQNYVVNSGTGAVVYTPPAAYDVPILMRELIDWLNQERDVHPVLVSGIAQFQLVHIHPFLDGNGRASRLLSTLCLYKAGYDFKRLFTISEYYDRDRAASLPGDPRCTRAGHGSHGMDRVLHGRVGHAARRGKGAWRADDPPGRPRAAARVVGPAGSRAGPRDRAWAPHDSRLRGALLRNEPADAPARPEGACGEGDCWPKRVPRQRTRHGITGSPTAS